MAKRVHVPVQERRSQLTDAAMEVMRRDGAWGLTTRAVATQAGVPLGAVHYAFGSKAELIGAVLAADVESAMSAARAALDEGGSAPQIVARALRVWRDQLMRDPLVEAVLQELTLLGVRDPELAAVARAAVVDYSDGVRVFLDEIAAATGGGWSVSTRVLGETIFAQFIGLAQNWLMTRDDDLLTACLEELIDQVCSRLE